MNLKTFLLLSSPLLATGALTSADVLSPDVKLKNPERIARRLINKKPVVFRSRTSEFYPDQNLITLSKNVDLFHELAHANSPLIKSKVFRHLAEISHPVSSAIFIAPFIDYALRNKLKAPYITYVAALASIPRLVEETRANIIGSLLARKARQKGIIKNPAKIYLSNMLSELGYLSPVILAPIVVRRLK